MKKKELSIDNVLNDNQELIQSLQKANEAEIANKEIIEFANKFKGKGRPKVEKAEKKKARNIYLSENQLEKIERFAKLNGFTISEYILFALKKELRKEGIEL